MIKSLDIQGYRCFERLTVPDLARVNVFVGRNNAGKTALLDAVDLLMSRKESWALWRASMRRGELVSRHTGPENVGGYYAGLSLAVIAAGRPQPFVGSLGVEGRAEDSVWSCSLEWMEGASLRQLRWDRDRRGGPLFSTTGDTLETRIPNGADPTRILGRSNPVEGQVKPLRFLGTVYDLGAMLAEGWAEFALTEGEELVQQALRVIEPDVERVAYLPSEGSGRGSDFVVKLRGVRDRVPMGSLGDGMRRLLALAMTLVQSRGGVLLVDEMDTGLHYSVMPALWRLVLETARRLDVQVFATTHSRDCLEGIAALPPDVLGDDLAVYRLERGNPVAVRYAGAEMAIAAEAALEVR